MDNVSIVKVLIIFVNGLIQVNYDNYSLSLSHTHTHTLSLSLLLNVYSSITCFFVSFILYFLSQFKFYCAVTLCQSVFVSVCLSVFLSLCLLLTSYCLYVSLPLPLHVSIFYHLLRLSLCLSLYVSMSLALSPFL
jgi:hypothetical protein